MIHTYIQTVQTFLTLLIAIAREISVFHAEPTKILSVSVAEA